jgi:hypothetical protein
MRLERRSNLAQMARAGLPLFGRHHYYYYARHYARYAPQERPELDTTQWHMLARAQHNIVKLPTNVFIGKW